MNVATTVIKNNFLTPLNHMLARVDKLQKKKKKELKEFSIFFFFWVEYRRSFIWG